jgi:hypothetical protein
MKNTKKTASTDYSERAAISRDLLKRIAARLSDHQTRQATNPNDWGYVGDLGRVNEELAQVLAALGDRSGVDELGLRY